MFAPLGVKTIELPEQIVLELAVRATVEVGKTVIVKVEFPLHPAPADPDTEYTVVDVGFNVKDPVLTSPVLVNVYEFPPEGVTVAVDPSHKFAFGTLITAELTTETVTCSVALVQVYDP